MQLYKEKWDGIERVYKQLEMLANTTHTDNINIGGVTDTACLSLLHSSSMKSTWCESFQKNPVLYLRMTIALDICIAKGRYAASVDLPDIHEYVPLDH